MSGYTDNQEAWSVVNQAVSMNTNKRINWSALFGRSLTQEVAHLKELGFSKDKTLSVLRTTLKGYGLEGAEVDRRLVIGVSARWGENNTYDKVRRAVNYNVCSHCGKRQ